MAQSSLSLSGKASRSHDRNRAMASLYFPSINKAEAISDSTCFYDGSQDICPDKPVTVPCCPRLSILILPGPIRPVIIPCHPATSLGVICCAIPCKEQPPINAAINKVFLFIFLSLKFMFFQKTPDSFTHRIQPEFFGIHFIQRKPERFRHIIHRLYPTGIFHFTKKELIQCMYQKS